MTFYTESAIISIIFFYDENHDETNEKSMHVPFTGLTVHTSNAD